MPCVSKCCCCCSLKYGNFAFGVIYLILRICALTTIYIGGSAISYRRFYDHDGAGDVALTLGIGVYVGWFICTSAALYISLKGIIQNRSILLYPYIVVMIFETVFLIITTLIEAATITPWFTVPLFVIGAIDIYVAICVISLYQHMKLKEKNQHVQLGQIDSYQLKHV